MSVFTGSVQSPGTGLFCVYAVFSAFGFVGLFPEFVGFMGKFVGILGSSLEYRSEPVIIVILERSAFYWTHVVIY